MSPSRSGRTLVVLVGLMLLLDGLLQIASHPVLVQAFQEIGFGADAGPRIALVTLTCAFLLLIPAAAPLGAVLTTGFLGGAICAHARLGEVGSPPQLTCIALGLAVWIGIYLAEPDIRAVLPLRTRSRRHP